MLAFSCNPKPVSGSVNVDRWLLFLFFILFLNHVCQRRGSPRGAVQGEWLHVVQAVALMQSDLHGLEDCSLQPTAARQRAPRAFGPLLPYTPHT